MDKKSKDYKRGPKPNHLKIDEENLKNAIKTAIQRKKPKDGWLKKGKQCRNYAPKSPSFNISEACALSIYFRKFFSNSN